MSAADEVSDFDDDAAVGALSGGHTRSPRSAPPLVVAKSTSFPYFLENVVATGAVAPNASWAPTAWIPCKRGKFYPAKAAATEEGEALLADLVQRQRGIAESQEFRTQEKLADQGFRSLLSDDSTGHIVAAFWEGEYDRNATIELVAAFVPEPELAKLKHKGSLGHLSKRQAVSYLAGYRVPLLVFDDMEALVRSMIDGSYVRKGDIAVCKDSYINTYLLCSDEDLLSKAPGKSGPPRPLDLESLQQDDAKEPMAPPHPQPLTAEQLQKQNESLEAEIRAERDVRDARARADHARSEAETAYTALTAKNLALQQDLAKLQADRGATAPARSGPRAAPGAPVLPPYRPGAAPAMSQVSEFLVRTMAEITSNSWCLI